MRPRFLSNCYANLPQHPQPAADTSETFDLSSTVTTTNSDLNSSFAPKRLLDLWRALKTLFCDSSIYEELPFSTAHRPSCYVVLLHLVPIAAAIVINSLNLYGYWIGKELSGVRDEDAPKQLALQLTAKFHELLMLASLSEALLTHLLKSLALGYGLPFASLVAVSKFKSLTYVWSKEFWAMCTTDYYRRALFVPLLLVLTTLGVTIGPSSATALIPRLDVWPAGNAVMTLGIGSDLWPSNLRVDNSDVSACGHHQIGCSNNLVWNSIAANIFSYWGRTNTNKTAGLPQHIDVPGISSLRTMDIRITRSVSPSEPALTFVSVQHAVIADMINYFRFLTFPSRSVKCKKTWSSAMCSYQDVSWFVSTLQPIVFVACREKDPASSRVELPIIDYTMSSPETVSILLNGSFNHQTSPQFLWIGQHEAQSTHASIGVVIRPGVPANNNDFVCSSQAQWTKSVVSATYANTDYVITSKVPGVDHASLVASEYDGKTISIDPEWAQQSVMSPEGNTTAFQHFLQLGETNSDLTVKLETMLAVLFAEKMAHTGSYAIPLTIASNDLFLKTKGDLVYNETILELVNDRIRFVLQTSMTGYGYGLYTMSGLSQSTLLAIIVLCLYSAVALVHLMSLFISEKPYVESWREERDLLAACLQSSYRPDPWSTNHDAEASEGAGFLTKIVVFVGRNGRTELSFRRTDWPVDG